MEITKNNFKEKFHLVKEAIEEATFLSIDGEFTGLNEEFNLKTYDTTEQRYDKLKEGSMQFLMIQFGLCSFKYDPESDKYTHKAFNFYTYPKSVNGSDTRYMTQTSCIEFLLAQGFDFTKLFKEGIPFLSVVSEQKRRDKLDEENAQLLERQAEEICQNEAEKAKGDEVQSSGNKGQSPGDKVPKEHKEFVNETHLQIVDFLKTRKDEECLILPICNRYKRKLIYDMVEAEFDNSQGLDLSTIMNEEHNHVLKVMISTPEDRRNRKKEEMAAKYTELEDTIGFSKVIREISKSGKVVVGHNMLLDILHTVHQFHKPLPETLEEFKMINSEVFPKVIDTKVLATTKPYSAFFEQTGLNNLLKRFTLQPFQTVTAEPAKGFEGGYTTACEQLHEAGYDAFITGLCFLSFLEYFGKSNKKTKRILPDHPLVKPFYNKVFMMMVPDIPYLNLNGEDINPNRDHVFHVSFPKQWKTPDLQQLFSPYGNSFVSWMTDETAFVTLRNVNQAQNAACSLTMREHFEGLVKVLKYKDYQKQYLQKRKRDSSNGNLHSSSGAKKQKITGSDQDSTIVSLVEDDKKKKKDKAFEEDSDWN